MRVALVHYHLQSGGVTRIITHLWQALRGRDIELVVLTGKPPGFAFPGCFRVVPGLLYEADRPGITPDELAAQMRTAAADGLGGPPDLWHVHNHSLGKSLILPRALLALAHRGELLLFHIHDFAEDGRPANYRLMLARMADGERRHLSRILYPQGTHLHYAVLNDRDHRFLEDAGLDSLCLHLLPNPVHLEPSGDQRPPPVAPPFPLWLYPTRAIRRKNLGEFLLWSALASKEIRFATTSGPENPAERQRYQRWKKVAANLGLPVRFELVGPKGPAFIDLLQQASVAITTSVAEGFGMAFLEPWTLGTPVCGRNLPEMTGGFRAQGIALPWCYDRLDVPLAWLGEQRVARAAADGLGSNLAAYGRRPVRGDLERVLAAWICEEQVDFGRLNEPMQEAVLERLVRTRAQAALLNPCQLPDLAGLCVPLDGNRDLLRCRFNLTQYGDAVEAVYQQIAAAKVTHLDSLDGEVLLDRFLAPERLCLLRVD